MSDSIEELARKYEENVLVEIHPRSIGLFTIPEYPEFEVERGMWSEALDAILTTLRYLAPATLLTLFWGQQSFLFKLLKHIDSAFRAIVFSSEEQKQSVLKWLAETGTVRVEHLETVWRHGWILCGVLDAALPGACAGHPPTRLSLKHAQAIADHYLGVEPVFSRQELDSNGSLSRHQEWKLATYLDRIREALSKLTPPVSKPCSQRTSPETSQFTLDYVARGSGLSAAQVNNKMYFKIYPTGQQSLEPGEITILIRGPKDTYGMAVIPPILGKAQMIRQKLLGLQPKISYTENALPITQGATYLRNYGKNDMNKTYHIPKSKYDIEIDVESRLDYARVSYVATLEGKYEISITSRGQSIVGSPFSMTASKNILGILERDSICLEDGEEIDIVDVKTDRKVVLRIVDFVTEKMLLKENGTLEKISDAQAKILMSTDSVESEASDSDNINQNCQVTSSTDEIHTIKSNKFNKIAHKVSKMNKVCKIFNDIMVEKRLKSEKKEKIAIKPRNQHQDIPDIVNSTFSDNLNPFIMPEKRDKYIIPENISVSIRTEKSKCYYEEETNQPTINIAHATPVYTDEIDCNTPDSLDKCSTLQDEIDDLSLSRIPSSSNPFLNEMYEQNYKTEKDLGVFVKTEYEANNSQNEITQNSTVKIILDEANTPSPLNSNPFIDCDTLPERPKTPVLKIITGDIKNRDDSVYVFPKTGLISEEALGNEFINPFFMHQHHQTNQLEDRVPIADFIIGAPVSLPPMIRAPTPEPEMESIIINTSDPNIHIIEKKRKTNQKDFFMPICSTSGNTNNKLDTLPTPSTFHSLDSTLSRELTTHQSTTSDNQLNPLEPYPIEAIRSNRKSPKKDTWDSAYVSIDDSNSSPDSNNNDNEPISKHKFSPSDESSGPKPDEICNMGPAEREIWETCSELKDDISKSHEDVKIAKWEIKRPMFTPIIEESDRSLSSGMKDISRSDTSKCKQTESDPVTVAFAELNDMYHEYFPNSESNSLSTISEDNANLQSKEVEYTIEQNDTHVDSASEVSDVKRHTEEFEGKISEVQANVTESVSVSQTLHDSIPHQEYENQTKDETQFGDKRSNIVLERKKYWDEKIRQIELKSDDGTMHQKKRRLSSKHVKHDSLTKRKGKQLVKQFLSVGEPSQVTQVTSKDVIEKEQKKKEPQTTPEPTEQVESDTNIVEKWKKYWDDKLETEKIEMESVSPKSTSPKMNESTSVRVDETIKEDIQSNDDSENNDGQLSPLSVRQELPEEVYKAFETSPKRFFGSSRKQILSKIDNFLGKPSDEYKTSTNSYSPCHDSGLVSSRISLFHNISNTEELPWARRKCQSLHNIHQRKDSERSIASTSDVSVIVIDKTIDSNDSERESKPDEVVISENESEKNISVQERRTRMRQHLYKSFDETVQDTPTKELDSVIPKKSTYVKRAVNDFNKQSEDRFKKKSIMRKTSISKSEMDIFNKATNKSTDDDLDKHKSYDELPKICVKNFISLYESASKTTLEKVPPKKIHRTNSIGSQKLSRIDSSIKGAVNTSEVCHKNTAVDIPIQPNNERNFESKGDVSETVSSRKNWIDKKIESQSIESTRTEDSFDIDTISNKDGKETMYLSLSDIELEIVESSPEKSVESTPENVVETKQTDYKSRFKMAKQFFQSLEELREEKKTPKLNECELLLQNQSTESLENDRPQKRVKKNIKSHSMPSSEIAKIWSEMKETEDTTSNSKLVKISEKFNVDDLFSDVMEGKLSRQGSLRGIPHKKAVLETFKSMENVSDNKISPYEMAMSQLNDFAKENEIKNAQTYLTEYPYLPTTDPSKYHSRLDAKASGLITFKELLNNRPRRNSVPDLRLNTKFTATL